MLEEAACELFLEQGYARTSVEDITRRAGVSRATFFNYVESKSDLLWAAIDHAIAEVAEGLELRPPEQSASRSADARPSADGRPSAGALSRVRNALVRAGSSFEPGVAVLAIANAEAMGVSAELALSGAQRQAQLAGVVAESLRTGDGLSLAADVTARAFAGAFFAALDFWAQGDPGTAPFAHTLGESLDALGESFTPLVD